MNRSGSRWNEIRVIMLIRCGKRNGTCNGMVWYHTILYGSINLIVRAEKGATFRTLRVLATQYHSGQIQNA